MLVMLLPRMLIVLGLRVSYFCDSECLVCWGVLFAFLGFVVFLGLPCLRNFCPQREHMLLGTTS